MRVNGDTVASNASSLAGDVSLPDDERPSEDSITEVELSWLSAFYSPETPVLSLYLDVSPSERPARKYQRVLKALVQAREQTLAPELRDAFQAEARGVMDFVRSEYEGRGQSLVIFACAQHGLWRVYRLAQPLDNALVYASRPHITPLLLLGGEASGDEHEGWSHIEGGPSAPKRMRRSARAKSRQPIRQLPAGRMARRSSI